MLMLEFRTTKEVKFCEQHKGTIFACVDHRFQQDFNQDFVQFFALESRAWALKCEKIVGGG